MYTPGKVYIQTRVGAKKKNIIGNDLFSAFNNLLDPLCLGEYLKYNYSRRSKI